MKRYVFVLVGVALAAAGFYVRNQNAQSAHQQAAQITSIDTAGDDTTAARADLASFVKLHTGASVTYVLTGSYNRAVDATKTAVAAASAANSQIYADAQRLCSGKTDSITQAKCNQDYLAKHLQTVPAAPTTTPQLASYTYKLASPLWAPDLAGALLLGGLVAIVVGLIMLMPRRRW